MKDIFKFIKAHKIKFVSVTIVCLNSQIKQIILPAEKFKSALATGIMCDGSSLFCVGSVEGSDVKIELNKHNFYLLPNNTLMVFGEIDYPYDARKNLKKIENYLKNEGFSLNFGAEIEFFMFFKKNLKQQLATKNNACYFQTFNKAQLKCMQKVVECAKLNGIEVDKVHHECGENQFELNFKFDTPLRTADHVIFLKTIIKHFAKLHGMHACFMPKPAPDLSGSGMHVNISIYKNKFNYLFTPNCELTPAGANFCKGIFRHIGAVSALCNPNVNSYKRLHAKKETPTKIALAKFDRTALIRLPQVSAQQNARIELRSPDISCNPYLCFASVLLAGFENKFNVHPKHKFLKSLPANLLEATTLLKSDKLISCLVPPSYIDLKQEEFYTYLKQITKFEIENYFNI